MKLKTADTFDHWFGQDREWKCEKVGPQTYSCETKLKPVPRKECVGLGMVDEAMCLYYFGHWLTLQQIRGGR